MVWWGDLRERDHLQNLNVDGRVYCSESSRNKLSGVEWIGGKKCRAFLNKVMNIWVS
jgi:hypothetical protein